MVSLITRFVSDIKQKAYFKHLFSLSKASAISGFGRALLFTCINTGVSEYAKLYARVTSTDLDKAEEVFFGIYGGFYGLCKN